MKSIKCMPISLWSKIFVNRQVSLPLFYKNCMHLILSMESIFLSSHFVYDYVAFVPLFKYIKCSSAAGGTERGRFS